LDEFSAVIHVELIVMLKVTTVYTVREEGDTCAIALHTHEPGSSIKAIAVVILSEVF
jgi:hypothetical protein